MAFGGGPLNVVGITPSFLTQLGSVTAQTGVGAAVGQVWQGAGKSFFGSAGQSLVGNLTGSAVNIALNTALGTQVAGPQGILLNSGANLLASTLTPYVTSQVAAGINQSIQQSLQSAGPFGAALSTLGTGLASQVFGGLGNAIFGATAAGSDYGKFPGGGGEPAAGYGGSAYTLNEVTFSIQPANQGPQAFGLDQSLNFSPTDTTMSWNDSLGTNLNASSASIDSLKYGSMTGDWNKFSSTLA